MKTEIRSILILLFTSFSISINAQISQHWAARYNGTSNFRDEGKAVCTDNSGNIYVTGYSSNEGTSEDITTIKYNSGGNQLWSAVYNGTGMSSDRGSLIYADNSGDVYVAGYTTGATSSFDFIVIKYNTNGAQQWTAIYNGNGNGIDYVNALAVDNSGNVYVTGQSYGGGLTQYDYATVKYNANGIQQWVARYNGTGNSNDQSNSIATDNDGNVYVTGFSFETATSSRDYATIKYNSAGIQQWIAFYNGTGNGIDAANSIKVKSNGDVYVTGFSTGSGSQYDYATVKYNSSGVQQWVTRHNGTLNGNDGANILMIDYDGNIIVTGYSTMSSGLTNDIVTIKYNDSGVRQWIASYNGPASQADSSTSMTLDAAGNVYVTGFSTGIGTSKDMTTIKYNSNGITDWVMRYNSVNNGEDIGYSVALDIYGSVYVAGKSPTEETGEDIVTIKYSSLSGLQNFSNAAGSSFELYNNYPNPFNPSTRISFSIPKTSQVKLSVYDVMGNIVENLIDRKLTSGIYYADFSPVNVSSGIYFYKLEADGFVQTNKMIFTK